jgi:hypothetical protein
MMTEPKPTRLELVAIEILEGLDRLTIRHNRDPKAKQIKAEFVVAKILEWASRDGD